MKLLWATQGVTRIVQGKSRKIGLRTAPSAGALYPLEIYAFVRRVDGIAPGVYHYIPGDAVNKHSLEMVKEGDHTEQLCGVTLGQDCVKNASVHFMITTVVSRVGDKYGERGERYTWIEVGHAAQNLCLEAESLGCGSVVVGAFYDDKVKALIECDEEPAYLICVGKKKPV